MPRKSNSSQKSFYHFEIILDNESFFKKTLKDTSLFLGISNTSITRKIKNVELQLKKFKNRTLEIKRIHKPVFKEIEIEYP